MKGSDVDAGVQAVLADTEREHWTDDDLRQFMYEGELLVAQFAPRALTRTIDLTIPAGEVVHTLDAAYSKLIDVTANLGADGVTPGRPITFTSLDRLQAVRSTWRREVGAAVRHHMADERDPRTWYTWPGIAQDWHVEARVLLAPQPLASMDEELSTEASYLPALVDYVLHRAYAKDAEDAANLQLSTVHLSAFSAKIGMKLQKWNAASPARNSGESPQYPATEKTGN